MRIAVLTLGGLLSSALIVLLISWRLFLGYLGTPASTNDKEEVIYIEPNASTDALSGLLEQKGLISRPDWFKLYLNDFRVPLKVHSGEYVFKATMTPSEIVTKIDTGAVLTYSVTIPSGARAVEVVKRLIEFRLGREDELLNALRDPSTARELGLPADRIEGYLFPDTYNLPRGLTPKELFARMVDKFKKTVPAELIESAKAAGLTEPQLVTLASLIETSAVPSSERASLGALLTNRLQKGMKLDHPGSVAYGLDKPVELLVDADYAVPHPFNTYVHPGLPPGPIANPGLGALTAAARPPKTDALYFAPKGDGQFLFCPDEECIRAAGLKLPPVPASLAPAPGKGGRRARSP